MNTYYIYVVGEIKNELIGVQKGWNRRDAAVNFFKGNSNQQYFDEEALTYKGKQLKIRTMKELEEEEND